jgi:hypothetical protein
MFHQVGTAALEIVFLQHLKLSHLENRTGLYLRAQHEVIALRCHPKCYGFPIPINTIQLVYIKHLDPSIHVSVIAFRVLKGSHMKYYRLFANPGVHGGGLLEGTA